MATQRLFFGETSVFEEANIAKNFLLPEDG